MQSYIAAKITNWIKSYKEDFKKNMTLALPVMGSQFGQVVVYQVDTIMVGYLGKKELAAVALGNAVFVAVMVFGFGVSTAISPLVSKEYGEKQFDKITSILIHGLLVSIILGFILTALILVFIPLLYNMDQPPQVVKLTIPYLQILAYSLIPMMVFFILRQFGEGLLDTKPGMYATIIGNVVNIILNFALIYGIYGLPKLGIVGAGIGTLIARIVMPLSILVIFIKKEKFWIFIKHINLRFWNKKYIYKIIYLGIPSGFPAFFEVIAFVVAAFLAGMVSVESLAAHQVAISLASISFMMCMAFGVAATVRVGNMLGNCKYKNLQKAGNSAIILVVAFMTMCALVFLILHNQLPWIYTQELEVIKIASVLLVIAAVFQIFDGVQVVLLGVLRGIQDVWIPTFITFIAYWLVALPISYFLGIYFKLGASGIWIGLMIGLSISAILLYIRFRTKTNLLIKSH